MTKGELRGLATMDRIEPKTEYNRKPDEAGNRKPATKRSRQPNRTGNETGNETNRVDNGRKRLTITDSFGTYQRMCGFGGGECRSVICTLREKLHFGLSGWDMETRQEPDKEAYRQGGKRHTGKKETANRQGAKRQERNG